MDHRHENKDVDVNRVELKKLRSELAELKKNEGCPDSWIKTTFIMARIADLMKVTPGPP